MKSLQAFNNLVQTGGYEKSQPSINCKATESLPLFLFIVMDDNVFSESELCWEH